MLIVASTTRAGHPELGAFGEELDAERRIPKAPSFISTPACSIETAVGAATWPSGDQVWKGQRPARQPAPTANSGNTHFWKSAKPCSVGA